MAEKTGIEWTDSTWNPVRGTKGRHWCTKVSEACKFCYAEKINIRFSKIPYVAGADTLRIDDEALRLPLKWQKGRRIFVCSMTDLFHETLPFEEIDKVVAVMILARQHTFQLLTKRPARMRKYFNDEELLTRLSAAFGNMLDGEWIWTKRGKRWRPYIENEISRALGEWGDQDLLFGDDPRPADYQRDTLPASNIWHGTSVENQEWADVRIPDILAINSVCRFISYEPALGPLLLDTGPRGGPPCFLSREVDHPEDAMLDWVIAGGESGQQARPPLPDWFRSVRNQCVAAGVPFFFKQWGEYIPAAGKISENAKLTTVCQADFTHFLMQRVGKKAAGNLLDGREHMEFPTHTGDQTDGT